MIDLSGLPFVLKVLVFLAGVVGLFVCVVVIGVLFIGFMLFLDYGEHHW